MSRELAHRIGMGCLLGILAASLFAWDLWGAGHYGVLILGLIAVIFAAREFRRLAASTAVGASSARLAPIIVVASVLVIEPHIEYWARGSGPFAELCQRLAKAPIVALALGLGLAWTVLAHLVRHAVDQVTTSISTTVFGMVYIGVAFHLLGRIAMIDEPVGRGTVLLIAYVAAVKCGDITAYFGGRAFGRHKMAPRISPGKTWEGFACSFVGAIGGALLVQALAQPFAGWWQPVVWGVVLGPLGVLGDLAESAIKRDAAVKDSGRGLPGFGGWLDLLDALLLAAPVAWLLTQVL